jgi:hypothetical protein
MKIALLLAALAVPALAADSATLIKDIEGVYKNAEDVIEIVRRDDNHVYVHAALFSDKTHRCNMAGVATFESGSFIYRDPYAGLSDKQQCTLTVTLKGDKLRLTDRSAPNGPSTCGGPCGAGGSVGDYAISISKKDKISNLPKLKASKEYLKANKEFADTPR